MACEGVGPGGMEDAVALERGILGGEGGVLSSVHRVGVR